MAAYPQMDEVFKALADPSRRQLLDSLNTRNGQTLRELCSGLEMARQSVSKHLAILEAANLVSTVRRGREKLHYLNAAPINEIGARWITPTSVTASTRSPTSNEHWRTQLWTSLRSSTRPTSRPPPSASGRRSPTRPSPSATGARLQTDWKAGSTMRWDQFGVTIADPEQVVLESDPHRRLAYTWHAFTPELAESLELTEEARERIAAEQRSKVSFELESLGELVKLHRPRRLRRGQRRRLDGQPGLAASPLRPQDPARDRRDAAGQPGAAAPVRLGLTTRPEHQEESR